MSAVGQQTGNEERAVIYAERCPVSCENVQRGLGLVEAEEGLLTET